MSKKAPIRIGNMAGGVGDQHTAFHRMITQGPIDAVVGDWLSEMNIAWRAMSMQSDPKSGFEVGFLEQLSDCVEIVAEKRIRVVTNAGALNPLELATQVEMLCKERGLEGKLKVASVLGDDVTELVTGKGARDLRRKLTHLDDDGVTLEDWGFEPLCGCAYIGAWGIVEALRNGADIVVCGRVTDASPVVGLAAWWYKWKEDDFDALAGALVAGRMMIEFSRSLMWL
jgi:Acyclic terpene utilisation family protein AtuA